MWKIFVGFIVFAALAMFLVFKGGNKVDMAGESADHGTEASAPATPTVANQLHAPIDAAKAAAAVEATPTNANVDAAASQPEKMSTNGTTVVGAPK
jgi:hypothetical protein